MRAVSIVAPQQTVFVNILTPRVGPEDVLVQVSFVGLCGTDLNIYRGRNALVTYPRIPGHEVSGMIMDKGAYVSDSIRIGDRVAVSPYTECGRCTACRAGRINACQFNQTFGVQRDGVLTRAFAVHHAKVIVNETLSLRELALVEPLSVGYHAANRGRVTETDTVLVIGAGAVGIGVIAAAARKGATVIAADVDDAKLETARKFGARHTINSASRGILPALQELTRGEGAQVAIEAVGLPETFRLAAAAAAYAGRVVYVGYAHQEVSYDTTDFVRKELDILGARNALHEFPAVIQMLEQRAYPFADLISKTYSFEQAPGAFAEWAAAPSQYHKIMIDVQTPAH